MLPEAVQVRACHVADHALAIEFVAGQLSFGLEGCLLNFERKDPPRGEKDWVNAVELHGVRSDGRLRTVEAENGPQLSAVEGLGRDLSLGEPQVWLDAARVLDITHVTLHLMWCLV